MSLFPRSRIDPSTIKINKIEYNNIIGSGNFCEVHEVTHPIYNKIALKVFDKSEVNKLHKSNDVLMEKHCLQRLNHPNIVKLKFTSTDDFKVYIATELGEYELWEKVVYRISGFNDVVNLNIFISIICQLINGLEYMHQSGIIHRDIKCENVVLCQNSTGHLVAKFCDFGTARDVINYRLQGADLMGRTKALQHRVSHAISHHVGTPNFMAPECVNNKHSDQYSDIWSFGCLIYQCLLGIPPFMAGSQYFVYLRVLNNDLKWPKHSNPIIRDLVNEIVIANHSSRLSLKSIKNHLLELDDGNFLFDRKYAHLPYLKEECNTPIVSFSDFINFLQNFNDNINSVERITEQEQWRQWSAPGSGSKMVDHLDIPELRDLRGE